LLGTFGFVGNNVGGILFALVGVIGLSAWVYWRGRRETGDGRLETEDGRPALVAWLRGNWRQVVITELVFAVVFAFWVWVRAQNPWLSGYAISYYYFGYVMTSVIARLAAVPEPIAFNLGIAWLIAGTATGAFGLVFNLVASSSLRRSALILGLVAALALPIAGN